MGDFYDDLDKNDSVLGRLQLYSKGLVCDRGIIEPGHFGIPEGHFQITDLGRTVDVLPYARRPKAIDMTDLERVIISHDPESSDFKRIAAASSEKETHYMYGVSFLFYERKSRRFLEFFCGSRSSRPQAKKFYPHLPLTAADIQTRCLQGIAPHGAFPLTLKSRLVKKGKYSWHVPEIVDCAKRIDPPTTEQIDREIMRFIGVIV